MQGNEHSYYQNSKRRPFIVLLFAAVLASLMVFGVLAHEFLGEKEDQLDGAVLAFFSAHVISAGLTPVMKAITFLASSNFLLIAYPLLLLVSFWQKKQWQIVEIVLIGGVGFFINYFMKKFYHRPRPAEPLVSPLQNFSFPSGHAMSAFIFYGLLIYLVWHSNYSRPTKWTVTVLLFLLALAIGFSRVYLRVHYPSDVIAGFCIGFAWIGLAVLVLERLKRKALEKDKAGSVNATDNSSA